MVCVVCCVMFAACRLLCVGDYVVFVVVCVLSVVCGLLFAACCLLFVACCLLFVV